METLQRTANRGSISTGFDIDNSLKLEEDNTEYLHFTPSSQTDYERMTFSIWIKRTELNNGSGATRLAEFGNGTANTTNLRILFDSNDKLGIYGNSIVWRLSTQSFRDTSAWYHLFFKFDTTQGTSNDRIRVWVNGQMIAHTDYDTVNNPGSGTAMGFNRTNAQTIGQQQEGGVSANNGFNGYIAQAWGSGGTPPDVTDFGETDSDSGIWKPIDISEVSIPDSNGFFLDFSDSSDLGNDSSSNNNDFTLNNITSADQATDTPTNNFSVLNGLHRVPDTTRKEGLTTTVKNNNGWRTLVSTLGVSSGKWYFELSAGSEYTIIGVAGDAVYGGGGTWENYLGSLTGSLGYYGNSATFFQDGVDKSPTNVATFVADDIVGLALDVDNGKAYFHKNGTYQNSANPNTSTNGYTITGDAPYFLGLSTYQQSDQCEVNYGGYHVYSISSGNSDANGYGNFEYSPPSGYYALCSKNIAEYG